MMDPIQRFQAISNNQPRIPRILEDRSKQSDNFSRVLEDTIFNEGVKDRPNQNPPVDKKLMDACIQMESLFISRMLKEMRKTVHKNEMTHGGHAEEIFEDMLYDEYSLRMSKNSRRGMAQMMYDQLVEKNKQAVRKL